eukprot:scaffold125342_cov23-Tisochrysis_lutea.AAC.2
MHLLTCSSSSSSKSPASLSVQERSIQTDMNKPYASICIETGHVAPSLNDGKTREVHLLAGRTQFVQRNARGAMHVEACARHLRGSGVLSEQTAEVARARQPIGRVVHSA